jgi:hypothetical protein
MTDLAYIVLTGHIVVLVKDRYNLRPPTTFKQIKYRFGSTIDL